MRRRRPSAQPQTSSPEQAAARGDDLLRQGKYKEAVTCFKQLVKQDDGHRWNGSLVRAYLGRAGELAGKEMFKEAIILWNNAACLLPEPLPPNTPVAWMIHAGQHEKAIRLFFERESWFQENDPVLWENLGALCALLLLTDAPGVQDALPGQSPLLSYRDAAREALAAYCRGDDEQADRALRRIPLRSPFKAFRLILKSFLLLPEEPQQAVRLLEKIPDTSPFAGLARVARSGAGAGVELIASLAPLSDRERELGAMVAGIPKEIVNIYNRLMAAKDGPELMSQLITHADQLPSAEVRKMCLDLLVIQSRGGAQFEKRFGPLDAFERSRLAALVLERKERYPQARDQWIQCIGALAKSPGGQGDAALKMALIHRYLAEKIQPFSAPPIRQALRHLTDSLNHDPDDKATWLQVIKWCREGDDFRSYHQWVDKALERFPDDSDVLTVAMESALKKKAFVKASRLAGRVLERDPINARVRRQMVDAHLNHAWKKVEEVKYHLVEKEIAAALSLQGTDDADQWVQIHQGLLALRMGDTAAGERFLQQAAGRAGSGIVFPLRVLLEADRRGAADAHLRQFRKKLAGHDRELPVREQVVSAIGLMVRHGEDVDEAYNEALFALLPTYFKRAVRLKYTLEEMRLVCDALYDTEQFELLKLFGQAGEKGWPDQPVFLFYRVFGQTRGGASRISRRDADKLVDAAERARKKGDFDVVEEIEELLDPGLSTLGMPSPFSSGFPSDPDMSELFDSEWPEALPPAMESVLVQVIREFIEHEFGDVRDADRTDLKKALLESVEEAGLPDFGEAIMTRLIEQALDLQAKQPPRKRSRGRPGRGGSSSTQLEMDLFE